MKTSSYNIICFGFLPWSSMWKRNQSMMAEIAEYSYINKVIFVNPPIWVRTLFRKNYNSNITSSTASSLFPSKITSKITVYTPGYIIPDKKYLSVLKSIESKIMLKIIRQLNSNLPYILFMNCPNIFSNYILDRLLKDAAMSIFDFSDDFMQLVYRQESRDKFNSNITRYAQAADIVLTVNDHVRLKYNFLNKNIHVLRNATNYSNFDRKSFKSVGFFEKIKKEKKYVVGYSGLFNSDRIDCDLLDFLIEKRPYWEFVFIGPADSNLIEKYSLYKNFHHILPVDYQILPDYLHYFDVAIVPFVINEHTKGNDLLKLQDYLAMGKPIVSTEIGGANDLRDVVRVAQRPSDFLEEIEKALHEDTPGDLLKRKDIAMKNSWPERIKELEKLIKCNLKNNT